MPCQGCRCIGNPHAISNDPRSVQYSLSVNFAKQCGVHGVSLILLDLALTRMEGAAALLSVGLDLI